MKVFNKIIAASCCCGTCLPKERVYIHRRENTMKKIIAWHILLVVLLSAPHALTGTETWTTFTASDRMDHFALWGDTLWAATNDGLVRWDLRDTSYTIFTKADGLIDNNILAIAVDKKGNVWCGTAGGVSRYNGKTWASFLQGDHFRNWRGYENNIVIDKQGVVWVNSYGGLLAYDSSEWVLHNSCTGSIALDNDSNVVFVSGGPIWTHDHNGWHEEQSIQTRFKEGAVYVDRKGKLWVVEYDGDLTANVGVWKYDGNTWTTYTEDDGLVDNNIMDLVSDKNGGMWFATRGGISKFDGTTWKTFNFGDDIPGYTVSTICVAENGTVLAGTNCGVIACSDGKKWKNLTGHNKPQSNRFNDILIDNNGILWAVLGGEGCNFIMSYDGKSWKRHTERYGLNNRWIDGLGMSRDGKVWTYGSYHPAMFSLEISKTDTVWDNHYFPIDNFWRFSPIRFDKSGALWAGVYGSGSSHQGVIRYDSGKSWYLYNNTDGLHSNLVTDIEIGPAGTVWFTSQDRSQNRGGITKYVHGKMTSLSVPDSIDLEDIHEIEEDKNGNIWIGLNTFDIDNTREIARFDGKKWTTFTVKDGVGSNYFSDMHVDDAGFVWGCASGSVSRYDGTSWVSYDSTDGLVAGVFYQIRQDPWGGLWFLSNRGVSRYKNGRWRTFTTKDGLCGNWVKGIAFGKEGAVWFATTNGLSRLVINDATGGIQPETAKEHKGFEHDLTVTITNGHIAIPLAGLKTHAPTVTVHTLDGRGVPVCRKAGTAMMTWDLSAVPAGVYVVRVKRGGLVKTFKVQRFSGR
jgi:ligand-binding sensor domain-containing protein